MLVSGSSFGLDRLPLAKKRGKHMAKQGKKSNEGSEPISAGSSPARPTDQSQLDFELEFFAGILERNPGYIDVLRVMGNNFTLKGRYGQGLQIDKRLVQLRPNDALAHYNLACSLALLKRPDQALRALRRSIELGYRDFRYMLEDRDLDSIRRDPRFRQLMREFKK